MSNEAKAEVLCKALAMDGMKPYWLGKTDDGILYEYVSYPWVAGADIFVMVRKPHNPLTMECLEALQVLPEHYSAIWQKSS